MSLSYFNLHHFQANCRLAFSGRHRRGHPDASGSERRTCSYVFYVKEKVKSEAAEHAEATRRTAESSMRVATAEAIPDSVPRFSALFRAFLRLRSCCFRPETEAVLRPLRGHQDDGRGLPLRLQHQVLGAPAPDAADRRERLSLDLIVRDPEVLDLVDEVRRQGVQRRHSAIRV